MSPTSAFTVVGFFLGEMEVFADAIQASSADQAIIKVAQLRTHSDVIIVGAYAGHGKFSDIASDQAGRRTGAAASAASIRDYRADEEAS